MTPVFISRIDYCGYALVDTKSHASKISKATMSKLLGGAISELVLILMNLDFEIHHS
jgi:hypothetical protein